MKKFYCNGKIVYLSNEHNNLSAKLVLVQNRLAFEFDNVCQALDQDQDMLDSDALNFEEVAVEQEVCNCPDCKFENERQAVGEEWEELEDFFVDMLGDEDYDHYVLPNGKSAPYGLTGEELAAIPGDTKLYSVNLNIPGSILAAAKNFRNANHMLMEVERDLIFATREKAVEAYNALFGDLYGTV